MKQYTGMYIIRPTATEEEIKNLIEMVNAIFTNDGGQILAVEEWGMKDMQYEIATFTKGYYVKFVVNATAEAVSEFDRICNIKEDLIRHILVRD